MLFKILKAAAKSLIAGRAGEAFEYPLETEHKLNRLHGRVPVDRHLVILFRDIRVGSENFADL